MVFFIYLCQRIDTKQNYFSYNGLSKKTQISYKIDYEETILYEEIRGRS